MAANGMFVEPSGGGGPDMPAPAARLRGALCSGLDMVEVGVVSIGASGDGGLAGVSDPADRRDAIC
jgi:hypothetical protein